jgi:hypothetical protein
VFWPIDFYLAKMGCGPSKIDVEDRLSSLQNAKIERQLREDRKTEARTVKILLLGTQSPSSPPKKFMNASSY